MSPAKAGPLVLAGAISLAAFLVTSPYMILDWPNASAGILREIHHYRTGHPGYEGDTLRTNLMWLWGAFGAALCLIVLAALHPARRTFVPLAVFAAAYFTLISVQVVRFDRNLMLIIPPLIVLGAAGFDVLVGALRARLQPRLRSAIAVLFAVALLVPGAMQALADTAERYADPRKDIRAWIAANVAPATSVFTDSYSPYLDPAIYKVTATYFMLREPMAKIATHDVIVVSRQGSGRFLRDRQPEAAETMRELGASACERREFTNDGVTDYWVFRLRC